MGANLLDIELNAPSPFESLNALGSARTYLAVMMALLTLIGSLERW